MKSIRLLSLLALMALMMIGCSGENDKHDRSAGDPTAPLFNWGNGPTVEEILPELTYEEFHGVVQPGISAVLVGELESWPEGCQVMLSVPAEALPLQEEPVHYIVRVPTRSSYETYWWFNNGNGLPLIVRLEPDDTHFEVPVSILCDWMPWARTPDLWTPIGNYSWDWDQIDGEDSGGTDIIDLPGGGHRVLFEVDHFSDYEVGERLGPPMAN